MGQDTFWCALSLAMCPVLNTPGVEKIPTDQVAQVSNLLTFSFKRPPPTPPVFKLVLQEDVIKSLNTFGFA